MNNIKAFDVLVVYTSAIASSASSAKKIKSPFQISKNRTHYNNAYAYFMEICEKNNLSAAFTTRKDVTSAGSASCYWRYQDKQWLKVNKSCYSELIFDKLSPLGEKQKATLELLFSTDKIKSFNSKQLSSLFFDKQKTFETLSDYSIPTVAIEDRSAAGVEKSLEDIRTLTILHPNSYDFSNKYILKDRFGSGGYGVYLVGPSNPKEEVLDILQMHQSTDFILQPFADFRTGYKYNNSPGLTDIRIIFIGQKIVQAYVRKASNDDFRCNEHQGGQLHYITLKEIPAKVLELSKQISRTLNTENDLYALDLVVSNEGNPYLMEGNIRPGLDWNLSLKKNERMAKKLIRMIVEQLGKRNIYTNSEQNINETDSVKYLL